MDDLQFVREQLGQIKISDLESIAKRAKVPFGTAHKIKYGKTKYPQFRTIKKLADYFRSQRVAA
jgi:hypothetical protein